LIGGEMKNVGRVLVALGILIVLLGAPGCMTGHVPPGSFLGIILVIVGAIIWKNGS
jgi:hypothetical protein